MTHGSLTCTNMTSFYLHHETDPEERYIVASK